MLLVQAVHFVSGGLTPPLKRLQGESRGMLSWSLIEGALPPGGNESRWGLVPLDLCAWEALDFKVKTPWIYGHTYIGEHMQIKGWSRAPGARDLHLWETESNVSPRHYFLQGLWAHFDKSTRDPARLSLTKSNSLQIDLCFRQANKAFCIILVMFSIIKCAKENNQNLPKLPGTV